MSYCLVWFGLVNHTKFANNLNRPQRNKIGYPTHTELICICYLDPK